MPPYPDLISAAVNIQDAIDAASPGDLILVNDGVYASGGATVNNSAQTNRVVVNKAVTVQSLNGPAVTVIDGGFILGGSGVRCVYLASGATLNGFTLTGGFANVEPYSAGGGVWCESITATVSNCVITGNLANFQFCTNCSWQDVLGYGSGAYGGTLNNCTLTGNGFNWSGTCGGGAAYCTLNNCTLTANYGDDEGGGAWACTLNNCTLMNNRANFYGGGAYGCTLNNCIAYYNSASAGTNYDSSSTLNYCCTTPDPGGIGNITNEPLFIDYANGNLRLQSDSPCINAGDNAYAPSGLDLGGNPRIAGGTVDMGAYEYQTPTSILSYAWAQQYGLPTDGSADNADLDGTGMQNWQKSIAGLNPTNAASVLAMLIPVATNNPSGLVVSWQSVDTRMYFLQCGTNLGAQAAFHTIQSNIVGQVGTTSFIDTNAVGTGPYFYRVGVQ
jgi:hypothetical protein